MAHRFILLVLPALALASIEIEISGKYNRHGKDLKVHYKGYDMGMISNTERTTFNLSDDSLRDVAYSVCRKFPVYVSLSNLTFVPGGVPKNIYQVYRSFSPTRGKITRESQSPISVVRQTFENNSTIPATFNVGISQSVVNKAWSSWNTSGELFSVKKIDYGIKIKVGNVHGEPSFSYTSSWGRHTQLSQTVTVGASSNIDITVQPGGVIVARLEATKVFVEVEMEYVASLYGHIAVILGEKYKGTLYHFIPVSDGMKRAGLSNQKTSREFINLEFFSDSKVIVSDLHNGHVLMELY